MAWFDIAAGLAQGAQQGIDRVQADQVRRKADAFKDAQEKRALAAEARLVDQDVERKIAEFIDRSDPSNLDPAEVQKFGAAANSYITKATDGSGRLVARVDPLKAKKRENEALVAGDFKPALAEVQAQRKYGAGKRDATIGAEKNLSDPNWLSSASDNNIRAAWRQAGYTDDVSQYLSRAGRQKLIEMTPAYIAGNLNLEAARASAAGQDRRLDATNKTRVEIARAGQQGRDTTAVANRKWQISKSLVAQYPELIDKPAELKKRVDLMHDMLMQQFGDPGDAGGDGGTLPSDEFSLVPNPGDQ